MNTLLAAAQCGGDWTAVATLAVFLTFVAFLVWNSRRNS